MKLYQKMCARAGAVAAGVFFPAVALAQGLTDAQSTLTKVQGKSGVNSKELPDLIGSIINAILGVVGIILLIYILYAGFLWMTAGGDPDKVKKAKSMIQDAIIGLVIVMASVAIANFVINALIKVAAG